jgi:hypothetical protein
MKNPARVPGRAHLVSFNFANRLIWRGVSTEESAWWIASQPLPEILRRGPPSERNRTRLAHFELVPFFAACRPHAGGMNRQGRA